MRKILFIGMTPNRGGIETYVMNIFKNLNKNDLEFYFLNTYHKPLAYNSIIKYLGGRIINCPLPEGFLKYFTRYFLAKRFFKHHNFDVIHINAMSPNEAYWAKAALKYNDVKIIFQSHTSGIVHKYKLISFFSKMMSFTNKIYFKRHTNIIKLAASNTCGQWMFGSKSKYTVVSNGINPDYFYPEYKMRISLKKKLGINLKSKVIITTARLSKEKNFPKIIRIFKQIHLNIPSILVIIGNGYELHHVESIVNKLKLNKYVMFLGSRSRKSISHLLNIGDLMLMPSYFEAVPFSLTEAQSEGVPAIVSLGVSKEANITGKVIYISLEKSDKYWAKVSLNVLRKWSNFNKRFIMNNMIRKSNYNSKKSLNFIKNLYNK